MIFYADECEEIIGYKFKDKVLLRKCFTHKSYANEHREESYEKLEYLGDAILDFVVGEYLFNTIEGDEGDLTMRRSEIVSAKPIAEAILSVGLEKYVLLGEGERAKPIKMNICSDIFESIVAAIYIDGGLEQAKKFIYDKLLRVKSSSRKNKKVERDSKSELQEFVQKKKLGNIEYREIKRTGPDHEPEFTCAVFIGGKIMAEGVAGSKKQAEQIAARLAVKKLNTRTKRGKLN